MADFVLPGIGMGASAFTKAKPQRPKIKKLGFVDTKACQAATRVLSGSKGISRGSSIRPGVEERLVAEKSLLEQWKPNPYLFDTSLRKLVSYLGHVYASIRELGRQADKSVEALKNKKMECVFEYMHTVILNSSNLSLGHEDDLSSKYIVIVEFEKFMIEVKSICSLPNFEKTIREIATFKKAYFIERISYLRRRFKVNKEDPYRLSISSLEYDDEFYILEKIAKAFSSEEQFRQLNEFKKEIAGYKQVWLKKTVEKIQNKVKRIHKEAEEGDSLKKPIQELAKVKTLVLVMCNIFQVYDEDYDEDYYNTVKEELKPLLIPLFIKAVAYQNNKLARIKKHEVTPKYIEKAIALQRELAKTILPTIRLFGLSDAQYYKEMEETLSSVETYLQ